MLLSVDPGDRWTGMAEFHKGRCIRTRTKEPDRYLDWLQSVMRLGMFEQVVIEDWTLDPTRAKQLSGKPLTAVKLVGVTEYLGRTYDVPVHLSPNTSKRSIKPVEAELAARGIEFMARDRHQRDAEVHGYRWLMMNGGMA